MDNPDVLSEVFGSLRIRSDLYFRAQLHGASAVRVPREAGRIRFHLVLRGGCWVSVEGATPLLLSEGDIALIPNGASQVLSTDGKADPARLESLISAGALKDGLLTGGVGIPRAMLLCGFCQVEDDLQHPAVANLPPLIHLPATGLGAEPWVGATLKLIGLEANLDTQGTTAILGRLIEIVVIQAARRVKSEQGDGAGFISALADPALSRALLAMHRSPEQDWQVEGLAQLAGMSRAGFADRFAETVGMPPIEYLTRWRLMRARVLLSESDLSIDQVAERCGYASLPSFSRRFKFHFGQGPGAYRRARRTG